MPLVTTKEMFEKSMKEKFAIGAFNVNNMEIIQGIVDAAAEQKSPVILQASSSAIKYARINYLMKNGRSSHGRTSRSTSCYTFRSRTRF